MRFVLDTNVLIAAFVSRGHCYEILEHTARNHELVTSEFILFEFRAKLSGKFRMPDSVVDAPIALQRSRMRVVEPVVLPNRVSRDPDDDSILATALAADADALISGDSDLLDLKEHQGIWIIAPSAFWAFEAEYQHRT